MLVSLTEEIEVATFSPFSFSRTSHCSFRGFSSSFEICSFAQWLVPLSCAWWLVVRGCWLRLFFLLVLVRLAMVVSSCWSPSRLVNLLPPVVVLLLPCYGGFDLFFVVSYCVLFCILVCIGPMTASSFSFSPAPAMLLLLDGFFF